MPTYTDQELTWLKTIEYRVVGPPLYNLRIRPLRIGLKFTAIRPNGEVIKRIILHRHAKSSLKFL